MDNFGKWFIYDGLALIVIGLLIWGGYKLGIPFGKLPGDVHVQKEKFSFYFPRLVLILTVLLNVIFWLMRK